MAGDFVVLNKVDDKITDIPVLFDDSLLPSFKGIVTCLAKLCKDLCFLVREKAAIE